jgi:3-phytase
MTTLAKLYAASSLFAFSLVCGSVAANEIRLFNVQAQAETEPAKSMEDAADDAEVWLNPADPAKSVIFGTDKKSGLFAFNLNGEKLDFLPVGRVNNVDLRDGFMTTAGSRVLIGASNRTKQGISLFLLDPSTLKITHEEASFIATDLTDPYGFCMYRSAKTGNLSAIVIGKDGEFRQFSLAMTDQGMKAELVRKFAFGSIAEGCVADDRTGLLYVGDELRGIWKLSAEPDAGDQREMIAQVDGKDLVADIEGLTLAPEGKDGGFLVASIQGNSSFALFSLPETKLLARFQVTANTERGIDEVTGTDGITLTVGNFGPRYPSGLFVVQDDENPGAAQNFKYVSWADVLSNLNASN